MFYVILTVLKFFLKPLEHKYFGLTLIIGLVLLSQNVNKKIIKTLQLSKE